VCLTGSNVAPVFGATPGRPFERVRIADTKRAEELLGLYFQNFTEWAETHHSEIPVIH